MPSEFSIIAHFAKENGKPANWTVDAVSELLENCGLSDQVCDALANHKIDGDILCEIREDDLRLPPLSLKCLGEIKRLARIIRHIQSNYAHDKSISQVNLNHSFGYRNDGLMEDRLVNTHSRVGSSNSRRFTFISREEFIERIESPDTYWKALFKAAIAFGYCLVSLLLTAFVMVLVHDRVPDTKTYPPLPDIVLDNLPLIPWAFELCELIGIILMTIWVLVLVFHKYRIVIMRRMFSLVGSVFLLRCVTMMITSLSVPGIHLECRAQGYETLSEKLWQAYNIWSHLGMSIQGMRTCGDYMFSGHTAAITLLNHFITECWFTKFVYRTLDTPETFYGLHTSTWVMNFFAIFFILAAHEHYSIDIFIAFYISSRMFLYYHNQCYNYTSKIDWRVRVWFPLGWFFESGSVGRVPNEYEIPFLHDFLSGDVVENSEQMTITHKTQTPQSAEERISTSERSTRNRRKVKS